jgi:XRE family aerobic/anaerobic benzoate catabolism transcriptional regulator
MATRTAPRSRRARNPILDRIGARIRAERIARGESRARLAIRCGLSLRFLAQVEAGESNISLLRLLDVAAALDLDIGLLMQDAALRQRATTDQPRSVALLGLRGAGKSSVGRRLAARLGRPFYELDALVEQKAGLPIGQIFELHGEAYFRRLEREVLRRRLERGEAAVFATGGGIVTEPETMALLLRDCITIWLRAKPEDHWQRVLRQGDRRPMRDNPDAMVELRALLDRRQALYARAQHTIETSQRTVAQVTQAIVRALPAKAPAPARPG